MKKTLNQFSLNSKVGKSWTLDSLPEKINGLSENFILGMTHQKIDSQ
ncbi:hypothetical protein [Arenibacter aquaticus]|nr:hypothetical protein [Arenibacter aquaticus]